MPIEQQILVDLRSRYEGVYPEYWDLEEMSQIAAKIALELAEKAYDEGRYFGREEAGIYQKFGDGVTFKQFIQDYIGD